MTQPFKINDRVVACSIYGTYKIYKVAGIRVRDRREQLFVVSGESQVWAASKLFHHLDPHFVVGDEVVIRPANHPGHRNDHICSVEHLRDRTLIVSRVIRNPGTTWLEFENDTTPSPSANGKKSYRASRFWKTNPRSVKPPLPNQAWATETKIPEPFEHPFKVGDKVITRPHDHPGHRKNKGDGNLVAYLDGKILTVTEVSTVNCTGYIKLKEDSSKRPHWASRFQPVPVDFVPEPPKPKPLPPNQAYADHIFERITQQLTDQEILDLASRLHRKVEQQA